MPRYKLFALDDVGRVDRGFDLSFPDDTAAIAHARHIPDAARVEVMRNNTIIACVLLANGTAKVI